jgi:hypothetical protein
MGVPSSADVSNSRNLKVKATFRPAGAAAAGAIDVAPP